MRPLPGMRVIGEYTSRFDADVAAARLTESGLESAVLGDPSYSVAPHHVVDRIFRLVVRDEVAEHATEVLSGGLPRDLEAEALDAMFHHRRFADRPKWIRWSTIAVLVAVAGPLLGAAFFQALYLLDRLFP